MGTVSKQWWFPIAACTVATAVVMSLVFFVRARERGRQENPCAVPRSATVEVQRAQVIAASGRPDIEGIRALVLASEPQARAGSNGSSATAAARRLAETVVDRFDEPTSWPAYQALVEEIAKGDASTGARRVAADALPYYVDALGAGLTAGTERTVRCFLAEVGDDEEAARSVAAGLTTVGIAIVSAISVGRPNGSPAVDSRQREHSVQLDHFGNVLAAARQGWNDDIAPPPFDRAATSFLGARTAADVASTDIPKAQAPEPESGRPLPDLVRDVQARYLVPDEDAGWTNTGDALHRQVLGRVRHHLAERGLAAAPDLDRNRYWHDSDAIAATVAQTQALDDLFGYAHGLDLDLDRSAKSAAPR